MVWTYVGTYNRGTESRETHAGIYLFGFDPATGKLAPAGEVKNAANPSFLCQSRSGRFLYSVNECSEFEGHPGGGVSAFSMDEQTGELTLINSQSSCGAGPCHLSLDQTGKWLAVSNYLGGSLALLPVRKDGSLGKVRSFQQHSAMGENGKKVPHVHSAAPAPDNRFFLIADLGLDRVFLHEFNAKDGTLGQDGRISWVSTKPGAGPRHLCFHPGGRIVYVANELNSTVSVFAYNPAGSLEEIETLPTLPPDFAGNSAVADIHLAPSGRFLYVSNRGHDSLAMFAINDNGSLVAKSHVSTLGKWPRNFTIDPTGAFLLAANQNSNSITVFRIHEEGGCLVECGTASVPSPACVLVADVGLSPESRNDGES